MIYELKDTSKAEHLFKGMDDSMIISCLQGIMGGKIYVTDPVSPKSAMAFLAEFAWLAGEPDRELVASKPKGLVGLVPQDGRWEALIRECWPDVEKTDRYAIKKGTKFDREKLKAIAAALPAGYEIRRVDGDIYDMCLECDDFEDAVQASVALNADCDVIVTNDKDFDDPFGLPIVSPDEFCREFIEE